MRARGGVGPFPLRTPAHRDGWGDVADGFKVPDAADARADLRNETRWGQKVDLALAVPSEPLAPVISSATQLCLARGAPRVWGVQLTIESPDTALLDPAEELQVWAVIWTGIGSVQLPVVQRASLARSSLPALEVASTLVSAAELWAEVRLALMNPQAVGSRTLRATVGVGLAPVTR
jgi:hypothetical protein